jgi:predicted PurR-regulated permease PerM
LAGALGLIAAVLDFVPNFGPIAAAIPAVALSVAEGGNTFLYVMGLYAVVQVLEAYVFLPLILKRAVDLPPVLTILVQLFMGIIAGPFGLVLGDPIAVLLLVSVRSLYVERVLESPAASAAPEQKLAS